jgi:hypothetical protein
MQRRCNDEATTRQRRASDEPATSQRRANDEPTTAHDCMADVHDGYGCLNCRTCLHSSCCQEVADHRASSRAIQEPLPEKAYYNYTYNYPPSSDTYAVPLRRPSKNSSISSRLTALPASAWAVSMTLSLSLCCQLLVLLLPLLSFSLSATLSTHFIAWYPCTASIACTRGNAPTTRSVTCSSVSPSDVSSAGS